jgi:hypothetical protein
MFNARKISFVVVLVLCSFLVLKAQNIKVPQNALLSHLLRDTSQSTRITLSKDPIIPQPAPFTKNYQQLIKSKTGLYLFIDGTGRVYHAKSWDNNWVNFDRIDSTTFFGFNKGSQKFVIGDTIFSFGGYGFWHFNGTLSYFTSRKEWEMLPLNKEISFYDIYDRISSISQFDMKNNLFYFSAVQIGQQTVIDAPINDSFYVIDINKRNVRAIGKRIISNDDYMRFAEPHKVETPWGILMDSPLGDNRDFILNIKENLIYVSEDRIIQQLIPSSQYVNDNLLFYQNGYLYVSVFPFDKLDSLKFDIGKFKLLNTKIYSNEKRLDVFSVTNLSNQYGLYLISIIVILLIIIIFFKTKKSSLNTDKNQENSKIDDFLTPLEKQLLMNFISKIEKNDNCSTDELNTMLGVGLKSVEIKKKARTDFITRVNYKLKQHFSLSDDIIIRERSEEDKRSYLYSIAPELISKIKKLIN